MINLNANHITICFGTFITPYRFLKIVIAFSIVYRDNELQYVSGDLLERLPYGTMINIEENAFRHLSRPILQTAIRKGIRLLLRGKQTLS